MRVEWKEFDFITNTEKDINKKLGSNVTKKIEQNYRESRFPQEKTALLILGASLLTINISLLILQFIYNNSNSYPEYLKQGGLGIIMIALVLTIILAAKMKESDSSTLKFFMIKMSFMVLAFFLCMTEIIYYLFMEFELSYHIATKTLFFLIATLSFASNVLFSFTWLRSIIVNIFSNIIIIILYCFMGRHPLILIDILFIVAIIIYFDICGYLEGKFCKQWFNEKNQNDKLLEYFLEIFMEMDVGLGIMKNEKVIFANETLCTSIGKEAVNEQCTKEVVKIINSLKKQSEEIEETNEKNEQMTTFDKSNKIDHEYMKPYSDENDCSKQIIMDKNIAFPWKRKGSNVQFTKIGLFRRGSSTYELHLSDHFIGPHKITEVILNDLTSSLESERVKQEFEFKSNLISKISHEFTNPLISIRRTAEDSHIIFPEVDNALIQSVNNISRRQKLRKDIIIKNLNKISLLSEYLFILLKELGYYASNKIEVLTGSFIKRKVNLISII